MIVPGRVNDAQTSISSPNRSSSSSNSFYYSPAAALTAASVWGSAFSSTSTSTASNTLSKSYPTSLPPQASFAYPPTPPIDMKSDVTNQQQQQQDNYHSIQSASDLSTNSGGHAPSAATPLPGMHSLGNKDHTSSSDHLISTLGLAAASYPTTVAARKIQEGMANNLTSPPQDNLAPPTSTPSSNSSSSYPYFNSAASASDLSSPLYGSYSTTGMFSSKSLQPSRARTKSRSANAGKAMWKFKVINLMIHCPLLIALWAALHILLSCFKSLTLLLRYNKN